MGHCTSYRPLIPELLGLQQKSDTADKTTVRKEDPAAVEDALKTLNSQLSVIHASLPSRTAFVIFTGHSDPRPMVALQARRSAFESMMKASIPTSSKVIPNTASVGPTVATKEPSVKWTGADARELEEVVELARRGMLFLSMKV